MSKVTKIQWCDSTVNPTMGCDGCELWNEGNKVCYAGVLHQRFGGYTKGYSPKFEQVTLWPGRMAEAAGWSDLRGTDRPHKPWLNGLPRLIFVSDMSDSLSAKASFTYLKAEIIDTVTSPHGQRHEWLWLTKQPRRMAQFSVWLKKQGIAWPKNLWAGTSITTQGTTARIKHLLKVGDEHTLHFISVEPQWQSIDLTAWLPSLKWVIQGGQSGRSAKPFDLAWVKDMIDQCDNMKVPLFVKQLGSCVITQGAKVTFQDAHGGDWSEWPAELRVRQFPEV